MLNNRHNHPILFRLLILSLFLSVWQWPSLVAASTQEGPMTRAVTLPVERVTVAAYNVENMFDVFDDPYRSDGPAKTREDIEKVAAAVREINADVIAISEVENEFILKAMVETFLPDMGYKNVVVNKTNSGRGIQLGVISRLPILQITSYRTLRLTLPGYDRHWFFSRDLLHVVIDTGHGEDNPLHLFTTHYKSKWDSQDDPQSRNWRLAEATASRRIIQRLLENQPDARIILAGDLNDTADSPTLRTLVEDGPLIDMHHDIPANEKITYLNEPYQRQIDFILASPALARRLVPASAYVLSNPDLLQGSDHAPIVACFDLRE